MNNFIRQDALSNAVLFKLFELAQFADERAKRDDIAAQFSVHIGIQRVGMACEYLYEKGHVSYSHQSGSTQITKAGYQYVEEEISDENSFFTQYARLGDDWLATQTISPGMVPAADRIVSRTDNQVVLDNMIAELEVISEKLRIDNEVGEALGNEREIILTEINASKEMAKSETFRISRLSNLIMPTLKFLAEKFSGAAIGESAKKLVALIISLF